MGCGMGKSTHSLASVFQRSTIVGLDLDSNSIKCAKEQNKNIKVEFIEKNMFDVDPNSEEKYDIICFFLCLHDMTWPTEALRGRVSVIYIILHIYACIVIDYELRLRFLNQC